jgi:hypothetical protein
MLICKEVVRFRAGAVPKRECKRLHILVTSGVTGVSCGRAVMRAGADGAEWWLQKTFILSIKNCNWTEGRGADSVEACLPRLPPIRM